MALQELDQPESYLHIVYFHKTENQCCSKGEKSVRLPCREAEERVMWVTRGFTILGDKHSAQEL